MGETTYQNGKQEGIEKGYSENGRLWAKITYKNDEDISGECSNGESGTMLKFQIGIKVYKFPVIMKFRAII